MVLIGTSLAWKRIFTLAQAGGNGIACGMNRPAFPSCRLLLILRSLLSSCLLGMATTSQAAPPTFAGDWETSFGHMTLKVTGTNVKGTYRLPGATPNEIQGTIDGLTLQFTYSEPEASGQGNFTLAADGESFDGRWRQKGVNQWFPWIGRRGAAQPIDFSGVWKTSFGPMRIIQQGKTITGCYQFAGSQSEITGTATNDVMKFTYTEFTGDKGTGEFKLQEDNSFSGTWKTDDGQQKGLWEGSRVFPTAGRTWLVVLEAHWEASLQQPEYSYGDMLRQFFSRVPSVAVRHRFFDGKDDFAKWCAELPYINEPTVFYVSSHGTEQGITVGRNLLTGEFIGKQLRYAPAIKLVHLGSCLTMAGSAPADLRKACGANIPVSGFTKVADWAGSAVIDFSYLDLVLSRRMAPKEAVRQIKKNVTFAGEDENLDSAIKPAGLKIVD